MTLSKAGFSPFFRMMGNSKLFSPIKYDFVLLLNRCGLGKHLPFPSGCVRSFDGCAGVIHGAPCV